MSRATNNAIGQVTATGLVLVLCCLWIAATAQAWSLTHPDDDLRRGMTPAVAAFCKAGMLSGATWVLIVGIPVQPILTLGTGDVLAGVLYAVLAAAHIASGALSPWDSLASFFALLGVCAAMRTHARWAVVVLLGIACGCSPLAAGALVVLVDLDRTWSGRIRALLLAGVVAVACAALINAISGQSWTGTIQVTNKIARVGPSFLWTLAAQWGDLVMPVIVLALLAVSDRVFRPAEALASPGDTGQTGFLSSQDPVMVWLLVNAVAGVCMPRVLVTHGLLFVLPAFLLVPAGWRVVRLLPFDRSQWTLSLFSAACYALPLLLLWVPLRRSAELIMAWLWVR